MRLTRVYCPGALAAGREIALPEAAATHVARVLRLRPRDPLTVFDGRGNSCRAEIATIAGGKVMVRLLDPVEEGTESPLAVTLIQAVSRGERMDWTLQKATELGVNTIAPVLAARSVVRLDARRGEAKLKHWHAVVVAACEQSGRSVLPALLAPEPLRTHLARPANPGVRLVLDPAAGDELAALPPPGREIHLLVGPEGGFDEEELAAARSAGFRPVRLGPRVLRTETAGTVALAVLQSRWGDLKGPARG